MINIREKYSEEIARIIEAAEANRSEAAENTEKSHQTLEEHENHLKDLAQASVTALSQFASACKKLKKLGRTTEPDPEFVTSTAQVFIDYGKIAEQLPEARENVKKSEENLAIAQEEEADAIQALEYIDYFRN